MRDAAPLLISTLAPSPWHRRGALAVGLALLAFFLAILPFSSARLPRLEIVIPIVSMVMFLGDCVSAVLLFGQFAVLRTRALLVLAGGYLFTGFLVVPYALTFPGAFSEGGLLMAGIQTAAWIFVFWHLGLPVTVMAYALLRDAPPDRQLVGMPTSAAIAWTVATAAILAALVAVLAIALQDRLPVVVLDELRLTRNVGVSATVVLISVAAFVVLARHLRSVLDLWLLVVVFAWVLDALLTWMTESRFTGAWYANRIVRIFSANVVLFVLLIESMRIYSRLAASIMAQRREREARALSMEAMAAAIEHEIRQPLGAIAANAEAAQIWLGQAQPSVAQAREAVDGIVEDALRASATLRSMRQLFADRQRDMEPVDANKVVAEAVALARVELESLAGSIQLQLSARLPALLANRRQLEEVILNLVKNAAESMRDVTGHAVVLSITTAAVADNRVEIAVADTGSGIPDQDLERIFDPFFTTKPGGTGMGLTICKSIVEQHGGTMSVSHATPYGSVFRVVLPGG